MDNFDSKIDALESYQGSMRDFLELSRDAFDETYGKWTEVRNDTGDGYDLVLVSGGWSENEAVIHVLNSSLFSTFTWRSSEAGGRHVYQVADSLLGFQIQPLVTAETSAERTLRVEVLAGALHQAMQGFEVSRLSAEMDWPADELEAKDNPEALRVLIAHNLAEQVVDAF